MSTIFVLGLEDTYTKEQLYQLKPEAGKTTVSFERLVDAAPEIAFAKDNVAEASGSASMCTVSVDDKCKAVVPWKEGLVVVQLTFLPRQSSHLLCSVVLRRG